MSVLIPLMGPLLLEFDRFDRFNPGGKGPLVRSWPGVAAPA